MVELFLGSVAYHIRVKFEFKFYFFCYFPFERKYHSWKHLLTFLYQFENGNFVVAFKCTYLWTKQQRSMKVSREIDEASQ